MHAVLHKALKAAVAARLKLPNSPGRTLLLSKNVNPKIVSEMPGHASISITLDIYSHLMPDMQEKAAKVLEEALG